MADERTQADRLRLTRRTTLATIGAGATTALAGCSHEGNVECTNESVPGDAQLTLFAATLVPTVAVKLASTPDLWQPRRVKTGTAGGLWGWQIPVTSQRQQVDGGIQYQIPSQLLLAGPIPDGELPQQVEVNTQETDRTFETDCRGRYEFDLGVTSSSNYRANPAGPIQMDVALGSDTLLADAAQPDSDGSVTLSASAAPGPSSGGYGVLTPPSTQLSDALREGAKDLQTLMTLSSIVYGGGIAAVRGGGSVLLQFAIGSAESAAEEAVSAGVQTGIMKLSRALTQDGRRVENFGGAQLERPRLAAGTVFFPPTTEQLRDALSVSDLNQDVPYGYEDHAVGSGEIEAVALGASGAFVTVRAQQEQTPTPTTDQFGEILPSAIVENAGGAEARTTAINGQNVDDDRVQLKQPLTSGTPGRAVIGYEDASDFDYDDCDLIVDQRPLASEGYAAVQIVHRDAANRHRWWLGETKADGYELGAHDATNGLVAFEGRYYEDGRVTDSEGTELGRWDG